MIAVLHPDVERLALLGWRLYPSSTRSRAACFSGATNAASHAIDQLEQWSQQFPGCNWRVVFGGSGIWGLDVDVPSPDHAADGIAALAALVAVHGPIPPRPMTRSAGGGACLFFRHDGESIVGKTGTPAPGLDPRRGALSVTVPPSVRGGRPYRWIIAPWELSPPPAPAWLLRLVAPPPPAPPWSHRPGSERGGEQSRRYAYAALQKAMGRVASARPGSRNHTLNAEVFAMARFIRANALAAAEVSDALAYAAQAAALDRSEITATLRSALNAGARR